MLEKKNKLPPVLFNFCLFFPDQVAARENLVASVEASAGEALGNGATARAFGSYGGVAEGGARREAGKIAKHRHVLYFS